VRVSAKVDYALRAVAQIALESEGQPVKSDHIALTQGIPPGFLLGILRELKRAHVLRSQRGGDGGYQLARPPADITLAEIMRVIDGPLVNVRDSRLGDLDYAGPAEALEEVWKAVRASVRSVLETVTVADLAAGRLPKEIVALAAAYSSQPSNVMHGPGMTAAAAAERPVEAAAGRRDRSA
jgi:Rrf2 family protein